MSGDREEDAETAGPAEVSGDRDEREELDEAMVHPAPEPASATAPSGGQRDQQAREREAQNWAVGAHLSGLLWLVSIPGVIGPLVVWLLKGSEHDRIERHAKEALNFQLSLLIYGLIAVALVFTIIGIILAIPLVILVVVLGIVFPIVAAVKTSNGAAYRYPLTMRLIS